MACGHCGGPKPTLIEYQVVGSRLPDAGNVFNLIAYPDCDEMWAGDVFDVYFVGRGTDREAIFLNLRDARPLIREWGLFVFRADSPMFCAQAIQDLLDGNLLVPDVEE